MVYSNHKIVALDFDGVLCNSVKESFYTAKSCWQTLFDPKFNLSFQSSLVNRFYRLRPLIEHGYDLIILFGLLIDNISEQQIINQFTYLAEEWCHKNKLKTDDLQTILDHKRNIEINNNLDKWLGFHEFYSGIVPALKNWLDLNSNTMIYILTTKNGDFAHLLSKHNGIKISRDHILGNETKKPKRDRLRDIFRKTQIPYRDFYFIEDRLKTLIDIKSHSDLKDVSLFLAEWGYNTSSEKQLAIDDQKIDLISLNQFSTLNGHITNNV